MIAVALLLTLVSVVASVYLLYCLRPAKHSALERVRDLVLHTYPQRLGQLGDRLLGPRFSRTLIAVRDYVFFSNNPIVMVFYMVVTGICYLIYIKKVFVDHAELVSAVDVAAGNGCVMLTFYFYLRTLRTPATVVTRLNAQQLCQKYAQYFDGTVYIDGQTCATCKTPR